MAELAARGERAARAGDAPRAEAATSRARAPIAAPANEWLRSEVELWPWIGRFLWSPAADLHPTHRDALLPGWPAQIWSDPGALAHVSRHLLSSHGLLEATSYDSNAEGFLLALLPQAPLARLARRTGIALHGAKAFDSLPSLDDGDRDFLTKRVPLYWHVKPVAGSDPDATGWHVLRMLTANQPDGIKRRFAWKTPLEPGQPAGTLPAAALLTGLIRKVLKELEPPWSSLFATLRRPGSQIRLQG